MKAGFRRFRAVNTMAMRHSPLWATAVTGGLLPRLHQQAHGAGACTIEAVACTETIGLRRTFLAPAA